MRKLLKCVHIHYSNTIILYYMQRTDLYCNCFDTVGWATVMASDHIKSCCSNRQRSFKL